MIKRSAVPGNLLIETDKYVKMRLRSISTARAVLAELYDRNPGHCGCLLAEITPPEARANLWGKEAYFNVPLQMENENPSPTASAGDISHWSQGMRSEHGMRMAPRSELFSSSWRGVMRVFFGPAQPYSPFNQTGRIAKGLDRFGKAKLGDRIVLNRK